MKGRLLVLLASLPLLLLAPTGGASHEQGCGPGQGHYHHEVGGVYVWVTYHSGHTNSGLWQESNGIPGLQRWDVVFDETCGGHFPADTEILTIYMI